MPAVRNNISNNYNITHSHTSQHDSTGLPLPGSNPLLTTMTSQYRQNISKPRNQCPSTSHQHSDLQKYNSAFLGVPAATTSKQRIGKHPTKHFQSTLSQLDLPPDNAGAHPPTPAKLRTTGFGPISQHHSFTQEACFEMTLLLTYKSNILANDDLSSLRATHPLYDHLYLMYKRMSTHDFSTLRNPNTTWMDQTHTPLTKKILASFTTACKLPMSCNM